MKLERRFVQRIRQLTEKDRQPDSSPREPCAATFHLPVILMSRTRLRLNFTCIIEIGFGGAM
jgi:hypothetical protein